MALTSRECLELLRHIQSRLAEADRPSFELLSQAFEHSDDPRHALVSYLGTLIKVEAERSSGSYGWVLERLNRFVRTEDGGPIRSIRVVLTPQEYELYGTDVVDLAELADRSDFIAELRELRSQILEDADPESEGFR